MLSEKNKRTILIFLGTIFIFVGAAAYYNSVLNGHPGQIWWLCYLMLIIIGIGTLIRNSTLIVTQINIMAIPFIVWSLDFIYVLLTGGELFGITNYFFIPGPALGKIVTSQHLFTLPLSIFVLHLIKINRKDTWKFSLVELVLLFFVTRILTKPEYNINCVYESCLNFTLGSFYPVTWFVLSFSMALITNFVINRIKFLRKI